MAAFNGLRVEHGIAERQFARPPVREDVDRIDAGASLQHRCDLRDAVGGSGERVHLGVFRQCGQEGVRTVNSGVDEIDLRSRLLCRRGQRGSQFCDISRIMDGRAVVRGIPCEIGGRLNHGRIEQHAWLQRLRQGDARPGLLHRLAFTALFPADPPNAPGCHDSPLWLHFDPLHYLRD